MNSAPLDIVCSAEENGAAAGDEIVFLTPDRATLAKRRWRGVAQDGREFGFDLDHALSDGSVFFREPGKSYVISQAPEAVLEIDVTPGLLGEGRAGEDDVGQRRQRRRPGVLDDEHRRGLAQAGSEQAAGTIPGTPAGPTMWPTMSSA